MPIKNREVTCDVCALTATEIRFGEGWIGWCVVSGIGATAPAPGTPLAMENMETHLCPSCKGAVAQFINDLQHPIVRLRK